MELFKNIRGNPYEKVAFDWSAAEVNAPLSVAPIEGAPPLGLEWQDYRDWNVVEITRNYLSLFLAYLERSGPGEGLLVHCVSGWDRTPLFTSLLRLSLWAVRTCTLAVITGPVLVLLFTSRRLWGPGWPRAHLA